MKGQDNSCEENHPKETKEPRTSSGRAGRGWNPIKTGVLDKRPWGTGKKLHEVPG